MTQRFTLRQLSGVLGTGICLAAFAADADNTAVNDTLQRHGDFSRFYEAARDTGVLASLREGADYTVFAPTNEAFAIILPSEAPCLSYPKCKAEMADIVRNHFVAGRVHISDVAAHQGGVFSIGDRFIPIGHANKSIYTVENHIIAGSESFSGGMLYTIDGVIANKYEIETLALLQDPSSAQVVRDETTIPDPSCGPGGCPDASSETITTYDSVVVPSAHQDRPE